MVATAPTKLQPPTQEQPLMPDGQQFTQPWVRHNQDVVDRLANLDATKLTRAGVTDGSEATAGDIGEWISANVGPHSMSSNAPADVGSFTLPAGDWDVSGQVAFTISTGATLLQAWVTDVSTVALDPNRMFMSTSGVFGVSRLITGPQRFLKAASGLIYLGAFATFGSGTVSASGTIWARRAR